MTPGIQDIVESFNRDLPDTISVIIEQDDSVWPWRLRAESLEHDLCFGGPAGKQEPTEDRLFWMLGDLQSNLIEHEFGYAWPRCPEHGSHPLKVSSRGWMCPMQDISRTWPIGTLCATGVADEPKRAPGEVRWFRADWGWGVIADPKGDIFFFTPEGQLPDEKGHRLYEVKEGHRVLYEVIEGRWQGRFRYTDFVVPVDSLPPAQP